MTIIEDLWIIHTTSKEEYSNTDDMFSLEIQSQGQRAVFVFPDLEHNERELGRTDEYRFDLRDWNFDDEMIQPGEIEMLTQGEDAWLPSSFWVISRNVNDEYRILIANPNWPQNAYFSTNPSEGHISRPLDQP